MSQTISFVASDELAEYLQEESERRMTTVSSTAQMLLAEHISECEPGSDVGSGDRGEKEPEPEEPNLDRDEATFEKHSEAWHVPNSDKHDYAVYVPEDANTYDEGKYRYYKTADGAAKALRRWYE